MKKLFLLLLFLLSFSTVFSWNNYGNNNTFSSDFIGEGVLNLEKSYNLNGVISSAPIVSNNRIYVVNDSLIKIGDGIEWVRGSGFKGSALFFNNSIIVSGDSVASYTSDGVLNWQDNFVSQSLLLNQNLLFVSGSSEARAYNINSGELVWNISLPSCSQGLVLNNNFIVACSNSLYSINKTGSIIYSNNLGSNIFTPLHENNEVIFLSVDNEVFAFNEELVELDNLFYFFPHNGVNTNMAISDEIFSCADNGLYSFIYENNRLYYSNFLDDFDECVSPTLFDFDNNGVKDLLFNQGNELVIVNKSGNELVRIISDSKFFSISDLDNNGFAEVLSVSNNGVLNIYSTTSPDNNIDLLISSNGFSANITNSGNKNSVNANLSISSPYEYFSTLVNIPSESSINYLFDFIPSIIGNYSINISINDINDLNISNNFDSFIVSVENITIDNSLEIIYNDYFYDFSQNFKSVLFFSDINGDNSDELIVNSNGTSYDLFKSDIGFFRIGDVFFELVNEFSDEFLENESLIISGSLGVNAVYQIFNSSVDLLINNQIVDTVFVNSTSKNFSFVFNNLSTDSGHVKLIIGSNLFDINEENNFFTKSISVNSVPIHDFSVFVDLSVNGFVRLRVNNSGDFNEELIISSYPSIFSQTIINSINGRVEEFNIPLGVRNGIYNFNLTINGVDYYFSELLTLNLEQDDIIENNILEINNPTSQEVSIGESSTESSVSAITGLISAEVSVIGYWISVIILLSIASYGVYIVSFKLFNNQAHLIAISNFILLFGVAFIFKPTNMPFIIIEEILLLIVGFSITRRL